MAETLRPVEIRHTLPTQAVENGGLIGRRIHVADQDAEAVAVQVAGLELVAVAADAQEPDAVAVQLRQPTLRPHGDRHHLPRHGMTVLQPGRADLADRNVEPPGHLTDEVFGPHATLFQPEKEEIPLAGRRVSGDLLDLEVFGLRS